MTPATPHGAYTQMSSEEQALVLKYLTPAPVEMEESGLASASGSSSSGCDWNSYTDRRTNVYGNTLWTYKSRTHWCWNGEEITVEPDVRTSATTSTFWRYEGTVSKLESGGEGNWYHRDYVKGKFRLCIGPCSIGHIMYAYSHITKYQYADGSRSGSAS